MEWIILFIISWILFFLLVDWTDLKLNVWGGLLTAAIQLYWDKNALDYGFYQINNPIFSLWGSSIFFTLGPIFVMGILLSQHRSNKWYMVLNNVAAFAIFFKLAELSLQTRRCIVYLKWSCFDSILIDVGVIIIISWFSIVIIHKRIRG